jgi:oligopeptide transport system permease protein
MLKEIKDLNDTSSQDSSSEIIVVDEKTNHEVSTYNFELDSVDAVDVSAPPTSFLMQAWISLRKNPTFIVSSLVILFLIFVALFPGVLSSEDPTYCDISKSSAGAMAGHPFGFDTQGCDIYARNIHGARASLSVGILTTILVFVIGLIVGSLAAFFGGWIDAILSRITDIFFAIPFLLGAIVVLNMFKTQRSVITVVVVLALFGWTSIARIARGAVLEAKNQEFVTASTALGSSRFRNLLRHVIPNAIAPVIVTATVSLGGFIVSEATLSFLGLGLPTSVVSWGADISVAQSQLRTDPEILFYPSIALGITVLAFIMLGDAVRDALDPKARK